ncbi:MAG: hypothetical protein IPK60_23060 [Sandaracinaceae bacterium]|nr:hypothetical protein [Sandaracinaceae bacterium]
MSQKDYYAGWDFERLGQLVFTMTSSTGPNVDVVTWNVGTYSHVSLQNATGSGTYVSFASTLQSFFATLGGSHPTYTVTFNTTTMQYVFTASSGTITLTFGATPQGQMARDILGFGTNPAAGATVTSTTRPYFAISAVSGGPTNYTDEYEPNVGINEAEADDGTSYSISRTTLPVYMDWDQQMEEKAGPSSAVSGGARTGGAPMFDYCATVATMPCSWEYFYRHVRCVEPFAVYDTSTASGVVCKLRAEGANFKPSRTVSDYDVLWNLPFKTRLIGRL